MQIASGHEPVSVDREVPGTCWRTSQGTNRRALTAVNIPKRIRQWREFDDHQGSAGLVALTTRRDQWPDTKLREFVDAAHTALGEQAAAPSGLNEDLFHSAGLQRVVLDYIDISNIRKLAVLFCLARQEMKSTTWWSIRRRATYFAFLVP